MKVLVFPPMARYRIPSRKNWEFVYQSMYSLGMVKAYNYFPLIFLDFIKEVKPDFVILICSAITEDIINATEWPKGPKYISWSTDDYRHTERVTNTDLHLSSIPSSSITEEDHFMPLFHEPLPLIPFQERAVHFGIVNRCYDTEGYYREREIDRVQKVLPKLIRKNEVPPEYYLQVIRNFCYGLNVGVYSDGLPNFRNFELGAAGVMPICPDNNEEVLDHLFGEYVSIYHEVSEIPALVEKPYDPMKLQQFYAEKHSFEARLKTIFKKFFDLEFPLL